MVRLYKLLTCVCFACFSVCVAATPVSLECRYDEVKGTFQFTFEAGAETSEVLETKDSGESDSFVNVPISFTPRTTTIKLRRKLFDVLDQEQIFIIDRSSLSSTRNSTISDPQLGIEQKGSSQGSCEIVEIDTSTNVF